MPAGAASLFRQAAAAMGKGLAPLSKRLFQYPVQVIHGHRPRVDAQNSLDAARFLSERSKLFFLDADIAQPARDADGGAQPFDGMDRFFRRGLVAQSFHILT